MESIRERSRANRSSSSEGTVRETIACSVAILSRLNDSLNPYQLRGTVFEALLQNRQFRGQLPLRFVQGLQVLRVVSHKESASSALGLCQQRDYGLNSASRVERSRDPLIERATLALKDIEGYDGEQKAREGNTNDDRPFD